jgi:hypothetical protein
MSLLSKQLRSLPPSSRTPLVIVSATLLILRSRVITAPIELLSKLKVAARGEPLTPDELAHVLEQVYIKQEDGSKTLLVPIQDRYVSEVSFVLIVECCRIGCWEMHFKRCRHSGACATATYLHGRFPFFE